MGWNYLIGIGAYVAAAVAGSGALAAVQHARGKKRKPGGRRARRKR